MDFVGRIDEVNKIQIAIKDSQPKIISIIGRRGVGKTALMKEIEKDIELIKNKEDKILMKYDCNDIVFINAFGVKGVSAKEQQKNFIKSLKKEFNFNSNEEKIMKDSEFNWNDLFLILFDKIKERIALDKSNNKECKYVFNIDEFPWLHTKKSNFLQYFSAFWNLITNNRDIKNVYFILTGSAVAWMNKNVINNHGGLYGKINVKIKLKAFNFLETIDYLYKVINNSKSCFSLNECLSYYMATNGVARYLQRIRYKNSIQDNLDLIFDNENNDSNEFDILFTSSFESNLDIHKKIVELFMGKEIITVKYISQKLKISNVSVIQALKDLIASDIISEYNNLYKETGAKEKYYVLNDLFCFSYLKKENKNIKINSTEHRNNIINGFEFEIFTKQNLFLIREKLGRSNVEYSPYIFKNKNAQIDLLTKDNDFNYFIIECKNYNKIMDLSNDYVENVKNKVEQLNNFLEENTRTQKTNLKWSKKIVFFSVYGVKKHKDFLFINISLEEIFDRYLKIKGFN